EIAGIEKPLTDAAGHELFDLRGRDAQPGRALGPLFSDPRAGDIVVVTRVPLDRVGWRHSVAVAIKQHPGEQAGLASRWAGVAPGGIAGELRRDRIPERRINDRDVVAGMG